jgi:hypothetical protein
MTFSSNLFQNGAYCWMGDIQSENIKKARRYLATHPFILIRPSRNGDVGNGTTVTLGFLIVLSSSSSFSAFDAASPTNCKDYFKAMYANNLVRVTIDLMSNEKEVSNNKLRDGSSKF